MTANPFSFRSYENERAPKWGSFCRAFPSQNFTYRRNGARCRCLIFRKEMRMPNLGVKAAKHRKLMLEQLQTSEVAVLKTAMRSEGNGQVACCNGNGEELPV